MNFITFSAPWILFSLFYVVSRTAGEICTPFCLLPGCVWYYEYGVHCAWKNVAVM